MRVVVGGAAFRSDAWRDTGADDYADRCPECHRAALRGDGRVILAVSRFRVANGLRTGGRRGVRRSPASGRWLAGLPRAGDLHRHRRCDGVLSGHALVRSRGVSRLAPQPGPSRVPPVDAEGTAARSVVYPARRTGSDSLAGRAGPRRRGRRWPRRRSARIWRRHARCIVVRFGLDGEHPDDQRGDGHPSRSGRRRRAARFVFDYLTEPDAAVVRRSSATGWPGRAPSPRPCI